MKLPVAFMKRAEASVRASNPPPLCGTPGTLRKILEKIGSETPDITQTPFRPIDGWEGHSKLVKRTGALPDFVIERLDAKHKAYYDENPPKKPKNFKRTEPPKWEYADEPWEHNGVIDTTYCGRALKDVTMEEEIASYEHRGYSEEFMTRLKNKIKAEAAAEPERIEFITNLLKKYSGKSAAKTKTRGIREKATKFMPKAVKNNDDEEE